MVFDLDEFKDLTTVKGYPSVSVTPNGVTFSKAAVQKLGKPARVRLLINESLRVLAITPATDETESAVKFCNPNRPVSSVRIGGRDLRKTLADLMEWDFSTDSTGYKIDGDYDKRQNAIFFELTKAKRLNFEVRNDEEEAEEQYEE